MDELRKKNPVSVKKANGLEINGFVADFEKDRVMLKVSSESIEKARNFYELDDITVVVQTPVGQKTMNSCVISELNEDDYIIIENAPSVMVDQKREHVRVNADFKFYINKQGSIIVCKCINISAGGIAFSCEKTEFEPESQYSITLPSSEFSKVIKCDIKILKELQNKSYAATFLNINSHDEDKIVKRIFELIARK